jgi:synaptic vesicle membrane protein VAT-1
MRQIWISKAGPPEVLVVKEALDPHPAAGDLRIRVEASGVNFADIMGRLGLYPDLPRIPVVPGYEVAGRVDAVGAAVDASWVGQDVFASTRFGGYADVVCVPQAQVFPRPSNMSAQEGASIPVNYLTAWQLIFVMGGLKAGETVLIHSAGGGVGVAATQIAKHIGATVIGTASAGKHKELRELGVDHLIDYRTEDFEERARQITGGRGVELILDAVGETRSRRVIACSRPPAASECSAPPRPLPARGQDTWAWCLCWRTRLGSRTPTRGSSGSIGFTCWAKSIARAAGSIS